MTRQKIRKKKPSDNITSKIPMSSRDQEIKQKTPTSFDGKSFELPPPRTRGRIPKDGVKLPSRYGSYDQNKKESIDSNISPPINEFLPYEAKSPTNKGLIPKSVQIKSQFNKKTPIPKQVNKIDTIPHSTGVVHSKKELSDTINKPPPPKIHKKTPQNNTAHHPTMGAKKERNNALNRPPPKIQEKSPTTPSIQHSTKGAQKEPKNTLNQPPPKIHKKTPVKKKVIPPPIFSDIRTKIPKTKLKTKKPK
ncbi:MAG: hypothetical protein ACFFAE_06985 [Candidatus Hodarchaeota archaeon]